MALSYVWAIVLVTIGNFCCAYFGSCFVFSYEGLSGAVTCGYVGRGTSEGGSVSACVAFGGVLAIILGTVFDNGCGENTVFGGGFIFNFCFVVSAD